MDSKKKARCPPRRYCTLCFDVVTRRSIPASSMRRSSRSASNGIEGTTCLTTSSMTEAPCRSTATKEWCPLPQHTPRPRAPAMPPAQRICAQGAPAGAATRLFLPHAGNLDGFAPQRDIGGDHCGELRRSIAERVDPESGEALGKFRVLDRAGDLAGEAVDGLLRHARRRHQAVPRERLESRIARLREGGNVGQLRHARLARHREQANGAAFRMRYRLR